jgi:radical SAM superfamily enzyme YgiQ (UPF0313 family)
MHGLKITSGEGRIKKELILVLPPTSHALIRLVLRFFFQTPGTFPLFILPALTPKDYTIQIFNQKLIWLKRDFRAGALVGISCATSNSQEAYKIADRFREAGSTVVMGGIHASYFPEEALAHADSVVVGEAESVWPGVIRDYESGSLKKIYRGEALEDYFSLSYEYFLTIDPKTLYRTGVLLSRGCKYRCEFCVPPFGAPRFVRLEQALALIERIVKNSPRPFGSKPVIAFRDDNIFSNPVYAKKLFEQLIVLDLHWTANCSVDIAFDDEALRLAKASGCKGLFIGFETIYPEKLQKTSVHRMRSANDYIAVIKKIKSYGIAVTGSFILGFDYYTHRDYLRLAWFLIRSGLYLISITILTPFPGSRLYEQLNKEGRITTRDWGKYDGLHHVVFRPGRTSALALQCWFVAIRFIGLLASPYFLRAALAPVAGYFVFYYLMFFLVRSR